MKMLTGIVCTGLLLGFATSAYADAQTKQQAKCINKINKSMILVQASQGKLNAGCVKDAVKTLSNAETCVNADADGKVLAKQNKTVFNQGKFCDILVPPDLEPPDYAYTSAATVNSAAVTAEKNLIHDVFGNPVDSGLLPCNNQPNECLCQRQVIDRVEKMFRAMSKIFVKCKNPSLAIGKVYPAGAQGPEDIELCVTDGSFSLSVEADTKGKVANAIDQLQTTAEQFCGIISSSDEFGGGVCPGYLGVSDDFPGLVSCLEQRVRCRFCQMINTGDNLAVNCTTWSGGTCP